MLTCAAVWCDHAGGSSSDSDGPASGGSDVWEQQCVLALFSAAFAALYVAIFHLPSLLHVRRTGTHVMRVRAMPIADHSFGRGEGDFGGQWRVYRSFHLASILTVRVCL